MNRLLAVLVVGLGAGVAVADIAPPPSFKRVSVDYRITTDTAFPDHSFFALNPHNTATPIEFSPNSPLVVDRGHPLAEYVLVAVPKDARRKYGSDKEFVAALIEDKVPGVLRAKEQFTTRGTAKHTFRGDRVTVEYKVEKLDPSAGLVLARVKGGDELLKDADIPNHFEEPNPDLGPPISFDPPTGDGSQRQSVPTRTSSPTPAPETTPTPSFASRNGVWVAGIATTAAIVLAGFWVVARSRRR